MSKVFSDLKPTNHVQRNGFDLSRRSVFSAKAGMITPVFCQATLPNSEYSIDLRQLMRTQPLQTAAFTGFSINYDFFFVPNNYGYSSFNEFISQRSDARHVGQPTIHQVPAFDFKSFLSLLIPCAVWDYIMEHYGKPYCELYDDKLTYTNPTTHFHYCCASSNSPWTSVPLECIRALDMFGYGNYLPLVKEYAEWIIYTLDTSYSSEQAPLTEYSNFTFAFSRYLTDMNISTGIGYFAQLISSVKSLLSLRDEFYIEYLVNNLLEVSPTIWPFLAYNKAFYEFYRNTYYDDKYSITLSGATNLPDQTYQEHYEFDYVQLFNYDDYHEFLFDLEFTDVFCRALAIIMPKYHLYKKDLFTGVLPSTQFGDVSVMLDNRDWLKLYSNFHPTSSQGKAVYNNVDGRVYAATDSSLDTKFRFDPGLAISVLEQRKADAMQRFKERMLRAGNKVKDVFKAHGWEEPYSAQESLPYFIGTFDGRLDINTVASTTANEQVELGQLAANGVSVVQGKKLHFKSHDFGYIVGVMYIIKDVEYDAYGLERQHCLTEPFDYPYPELQNISLFPVDSLELSSYLRTPNIQQDDNDVRPAILGYLPRFMEYKTAVDKVHGEFFSAPINLYSNPSKVKFGVFSDWVTPRQELKNADSLSFLYHSPKSVDNVFLQASSALQSSDQFLFNVLFDVMAVEPLSVIGLPI